MNNARNLAFARLSADFNRLVRVTQPVTHILSAEVVFDLSDKLFQKIRERLSTRKAVVVKSLKRQQPRSGGEGRSADNTVAVETYLYPKKTQLNLCIAMKARVLSGFCAFDATHLLGIGESVAVDTRFIERLIRRLSRDKSRSLVQLRFLGL